MTAELQDILQLCLSDWGDTGQSRNIVGRKKDDICINKFWIQNVILNTVV